MYTCNQYNTLLKLTIINTVANTQVTMEYTQYDIAIFFTVYTHKLLATLLLHLHC